MTKSGASVPGLRLDSSGAAVDTAPVRDDTRRLILFVLIVCGCARSGESEPAPVIVLSAENARTYQRACATCHARPGIGAPLCGVDEDWRERRAQGIDTLLVHTVEGYRGMPPLGTCGLCSADDFRALIRYMAGMP